MQPINASLIVNAVQSGRGRKALALSLGLAVCIATFGAQAQYYDRDWGGYRGPYGYYRGGPYGPYADYDQDDVGPGYRGQGYGYDRSVAPRYRGPGPASQAAPLNQRSDDVISLDMIEKRIKAAGFKLVAPPRHKGNIYLAEVEDKSAIRHRLVYDAHDGRLIENTALGPVKKLIVPSEENQPPRATKPDRSGKANESGGAKPSEQAKNLSPVQNVNAPAPATPTEPTSSAPLNSVK